ncbi:RPA family protein [Halobacterium zhouii]|uniref:RPA family protein n=1 Tax=Halobacterium zhouii TaxID=2902624 RepID=UPI001E307D13|nr:RPA family protein [Halobacterium zhouii]
MSQAPTREVARRVFATEFNDAQFTFKESDDERAPLYALLPTGESANRVFVVGTLTETEDIGEDSEYWRGRVVDPTGTFFIYAGQYQPDAASMLRELDTPTYVAVVGKPRTFETDDGSVNVSLRPESITVVEESTRDRWVVETAERTMDRLAAFDEEGNEYAERAKQEYSEDVSPYRRAVLEALEDFDSESADGGNADDAEAEPTPDA